VTRPRLGCVVLTMGRRPDDLARALASLRSQSAVDLDVVVVGNGWTPVGLPDDVRGVALPENVGIPAGRAAGVPRVGGDLLVFLDDDVWLPDPDTLAAMARVFDDGRVGLVQPRVEDPGGKPAPRRWVPRLRVGDPRRSSDVVAVWEGCLMVRRDVYERCGGWAPELFYGHEGVDLAWGVWGAGYRVRYVGDVRVHHPATPATRHAGGNRLWARNRVWIARRRLPAPVAVVYVLVWLVLSLVRTRSARGDVVQGFLDGLRDRPSVRRPVPWRAVLRMTRAGRPPIV
jgi:GT2 family glycosyltransferase